MVQNMQNNNVQPELPADPAAEFIGGANGAGSNVSPEEQEWMRANLEDMFKKIEERKIAFDENRKRIAGRGEDNNKRLINELFALMKKSGVNPGDLNSVSKFLQKLEADNPDLLLMFRGIIDSCFGEEPSNMLAPKEGGLMEGATTNLQNNILRK